MPGGDRGRGGYESVSGFMREGGFMRGWVCIERCVRRRVYMYVVSHKGVTLIR